MGNFILTSKMNGIFQRSPHLNLNKIISYSNLPDELKLIMYPDSLTCPLINELKISLNYYTLLPPNNTLLKFILSINWSEYNLKYDCKYNKRERILVFD